MEFALSKAYRSVEQSTPMDARSSLLSEQRDWIQARNKKCGLLGSDNLPFKQLQPAAPCMEQEIAARLATLQDRAQNKVSANAANLCQPKKHASDRLICSDSDLRAAMSAVTKAYQEAKASVSDQSSIEQEQKEWAQARDKKCGLQDKDKETLDELLQTKPCMEAELTERLADLGRTLSASISQPQAALRTEGPVSIDLSSISSDYRSFQFSTGEKGIAGTITCSAPSMYGNIDPLANSSFTGKAVTKIVIDDDVRSYRMFADDSWIESLTKLRVSAQTACSKILATGKLKDAANQPVAELSKAFEAVSKEGIFLAYSIGPSSPWILQFDLPHIRKKMMSELGIRSWVEPTQLEKNPYFYKGVVVGMVVQFDHPLSQGDGILSFKGANLFATELPPQRFKEKEMVIFAGRVKGNRGVIEASGDEELIPELQYVGSAKCGSACGMLEIPPPEAQDDPIRKLKQQ